MRAMIKLGVGASLSLCMFVAGCEQESVQEETGVGDGTIVCPGHPQCPPEDYYGVIIPSDVARFNATRPTQVVCVEGDPERPTICPRGTEQNLRMEGRLWTKANVQISCYPGKQHRLCPANAYAFFCRKNEPCPGIPGTNTGLVGGAAKPSTTARE